MSPIKMNTSQFIIQRIRDAGADTIFGIPGDYILPFFDDLTDPKSPVKHWGTTNELTATNLADGNARERGFGAVAVTFGPGIYNTVNGVAGCYEENVPLFVISGAPNVSEYGKGKLLHHVVGRNTECCMQVMKPITAAAERIDDVADAVEIVDRLITVALSQKKPVYLELPYNIQIAQTSALEVYSATYQHPEHGGRHGKDYEMPSTGDKTDHSSWGVDRASSNARHS